MQLVIENININNINLQYIKEIFKTFRHYVSSCISPENIVQLKPFKCLLKSFQQF